MGELASAQPSVMEAFSKLHETAGAPKEEIMEALSVVDT